MAVFLLLVVARIIPGVCLREEAIPVFLLVQSRKPWGRCVATIAGQLNAGCGDASRWPAAPTSSRSAMYASAVLAGL